MGIFPYWEGILGTEEAVLTLPHDLVSHQKFNYYNNPESNKLFHICKVVK
jgi:hypothetical protein